jgi:RNA polymerase nonessential primary-like sigma factor
MNQSRTVRLPIHVIKELNIYLRAGKALAKQLDHKPTPEEIAEMIDKPVEEIREILALAPDAISIDTPLMQDSQKTLVDIIADDNNIDPSSLVQQADLAVHMTHWLEALNDREREVIMRRFGLQGHERGTLEEVGKAIGLTRERVRQLQLEGLKKLRHLVEAEGLTKEDSAE